MHAIFGHAWEKRRAWTKPHKPDRVSYARADDRNDAEMALLGFWPKPARTACAHCRGVEYPVRK